MDHVDCFLIGVIFVGELVFGVDGGRDEVLVYLVFFYGLFEGYVVGFVDGVLEGFDFFAVYIPC